MIAGTEIAHEATVTVAGEETSLVLVQETPGGLIFAVDASYVAQEIGPITSPYGNGTVILNNDPVVDGAEFQPDALRITYPQGAPGFPVHQWRQEVARKGLIEGYYEWLSAKLINEFDCTVMEATQ